MGSYGLMGVLAFYVVRLNSIRNQLETQGASPRFFRGMLKTGSHGVGITNPFDWFVWVWRGGLWLVYVCGGAYHVAALIQIQAIAHRDKQKQVKSRNQILIVEHCWHEFNYLLHSFTRHPETQVCNTHVAHDQIYHFHNRCKIKPHIYYIYMYSILE